ncbi:MAG TPA: PadR family transcriptional regulator [Bacteroidetes bacterium]|nr:PadR family transcriptional regulator [Bacteroidota bacterium]
MKGKKLGELEELVLLTIGALYDEAYGVAISKYMAEQAGRQVGLGAMHATLVRLEDKGYLESRFGEATKMRGGKRKRYFRVTAAGQRALKTARDIRARLWNAIPKTAFNISFQ